MSTRLIGVIEGFYGKCWSDAQRKSMIDFLAANQFNSYVYAPKSDGFLRRHWDQPWSMQHHCNLAELAAHCRTRGVDFGVGLSPLDVFSNYNEAAKQQLACKVGQIQALGSRTLCLLFDDMRGDQCDLAAQQLQIIEDVRRWFEGRLIVCPTYYSHDPVLAQVFGEMPAGYLGALGAGLAADVDVFWTGPQVISPAISSEHIAEVSQALKRPPLLWDNFIANDGRKTADRLPIKSFESREPSALQACAGVLVNPMNQAELAKPSLLTLAALLAGDELPIEAAMEKVFPARLAQLLQRDYPLFLQRGRSNIQRHQRIGIVDAYQSIDHPAAVELCRWLAGFYQFDPACLTD